MKALIIFGLIVLIIGLVHFRPTDPTDKSRSKRSGMNFYKDYGTGCEYLSAPSIFGGSTLIPRLDENGKHICTSDVDVSGSAAKVE